MGDDDRRIRAPLRRGADAMHQHASALASRQALMADHYHVRGLEPPRLYTVALLSLRLRDRDAALAASHELARRAAAGSSFVRDLESEVRAHIALFDGQPQEGLRILETIERGPASLVATNAVPFYAFAHERFLHGELLLAAGRDADALSWFASLGTLSVPEAPLRALAHLRQAEIHDRLGNHAAASDQYARTLALWERASPEFATLVNTAQQRRTTLLASRARR